jgi:hypothetical protein
LIYSRPIRIQWAALSPSSLGIYAFLCDKFESKIFAGASKES